MIAEFGHKLSSSNWFYTATATSSVGEMTDTQNPSTQMPKLRALRRSRLGTRAHRDVAAEVSRIISKNLREARRRCGYSLEALAQKSGVSRAMLGQIETSKSVPTVTVIWRIADALGLPIGALLSNPEQQPAQIIRGASHRGVSGTMHPLGQSLSLDEAEAELRFFEISLAPQQAVGLVPQSLPLRAILVVAVGRLSLECPPDATIDLECGDTAVFDAQRSGRLINCSALPAKAFLALFPKRTR